MLPRIAKLMTNLLYPPLYGAGLKIWTKSRFQETNGQTNKVEKIKKSTTLWKTTKSYTLIAQNWTQI